MKIHLFNLKLNQVYHHPEMVCEYSFDYRDDVYFNNPKAIYTLATEILQMHLFAEEYVYVFCLDTSMYHVFYVEQVITCLEIPKTKRKKYDNMLKM